MYGRVLISNILAKMDFLFPLINIFRSAGNTYELPRRSECHKDDLKNFRKTSRLI